MLKSKALKFSVSFIVLFLAFYYFNIGFFSLTSPESNHYNSFLGENLNYIALLRSGLLSATAFSLKCIGFASVTSDYELLVAGRGGIRLVYSCLGLGVMSFFAAFVLAYPKKTKPKIIFLVSGLLIIELLNVIRMAMVALFWSKQAQQIIDHHIIFNGIIYTIICIVLYFWVTTDDKKPHAKN